MAERKNTAPCGRGSERVATPRPLVGRAPSPARDPLVALPAGLSSVHPAQAGGVAEPRPKGAVRGQTTVEFVLAFAGIVFPLTFAIVYTSQLLWIWHSVNDFTRQGASYASTHCWESSAGNVTDFMRANVPPMIDRDQFQNSQVAINITYAAKDPDSGQLVPFSCDSECSTTCIPDTVSVSLSRTARARSRPTSGRSRPSPFASTRTPSRPTT